uniref:Transmembrane protein 107 n=1 Tax=Bos taurus TaxID=9913 RepID=F6QLU0_BOVIN
SGGDCGVRRVILGKVAGAGAQAAPGVGIPGGASVRVSVRQCCVGRLGNVGPRHNTLSGCADSSSARGKADGSILCIRSGSAQDSNIQACLPLKFTPEEYEKQDIQLVAALSVTLALFAVELAGFFLGVSMFNSTQSLISIGAHCGASVALSFFIFERWECTTYWYIFVFCSALPAVTEITLFISVFGLKKKPF